MSKGSLFWGKGSGKLGETVLYRAGGEQRTRTYVSKIKNPKTLAQMKNRLSMRNFAQCYRAMQAVLSKSFPNRPQNESGFNAFVKANKNAATAVLDKFSSAAGLCAPVDMVMAQGYLTQFGVCERHNILGDDYVGFSLMAHPNITSIISLWQDGEGTNITTSVLFKKVWDALQIPHSGVFTIIWATYEDEGYAVKTYRLTYDSSDAELGALPSNLFMAGLSLTGEGITPCLAIASAADTEVLCTAIISWVDGNGKLQVTTSRMVSPVANDTYAAQFLPGGDYYQQVLEEYGYSQDSTL